MSLWERRAVWAIKDHPTIDLLVHLCPSMESALMYRQHKKMMSSLLVSYFNALLITGEGEGEGGGWS